MHLFGSIFRSSLQLLVKIPAEYFDFALIFYYKVWNKIRNLLNWYPQCVLTHQPSVRWFYGFRISSQILSILSYTVIWQSTTQFTFAQNFFMINIYGLHLTVHIESHVIDGQFLCRWKLKNIEKQLTETILV